MLNHKILKGVLLGLLAGLLTTIFDSLYLLTPNIHIPHIYPLALVCFNFLFWSTFGFFSGFIQWPFYKLSKNSHGKEPFLWIVFFLLPFALMYGFLGEMETDVLGLFEELPYFGSHFAFYPAILIPCFLFFYFIKSKKKEQFLPFTFILEILTIIILFQFCINIVAIPIFSAPYHRFTNFFQAINITRNACLIVVYIFGIILITGFYFITFFKLNPVLVKFSAQYYRKTVSIVLILVLSFLSGAGMLSYWLYTKERVPLIAHSETKEGKKPPSVILIVLDTLRADHLSIYGYNRRNKYLEEFARDALVFENCFSTTGWTLPAHASLFTGLYPTENGCHGDLQKKGLFYFNPLPMPLDEKFVTLAEIFKQHGYETSAVIANFIGLNKDFHVDQGFDSYDCIPSIGDLNRRYRFRPIIQFFSYLTNFDSEIVLNWSPAETITDKSLRIVANNSRSPFFLFINYMDTHEPYYPPRPFSNYFITGDFPALQNLKTWIKHIINRLNTASINNYKISQYDGAIAYLDNQLGRFFNELKRMGVYDSSLIIVTADHGELFGEHGLYGHRQLMYQGELHVPLLIKLPSNARVGREKKHIQLTDVFATILSITGLPIEEGISGKPFGNQLSSPVAEYEDFKTGQQRVIFQGNYKLMRYDHGRASELYDLDKDPREENNLAGTMPDKKKELELSLNEWVQQHKPRYALSVKESISQGTIRALKDLGYIQ